METFIFEQDMEDASNYINLYKITSEMLDYCKKYLKENKEYPKDFGDLLGWINY